MSLVEKSKTKPAPDSGGSRSTIEDTRHLGFEPIRPPRWFSTPPFPASPEPSAQVHAPAPATAPVRPPTPTPAALKLAEFPVLLPREPEATIPPTPPVFITAPEPITIIPAPAPVSPPAPVAAPALIIAPAVTPAAASTSSITTAPFITAPASPVSLGGIPAAPELTRRPSQSMSVNAVTRFIKLSISVGIVLGILYFGAKNVIPFIQELSHPGNTAPPSKNDSVGVKVLKQTRGVIAKNDANVANLDAIIAFDDPNYKPIPLPELPQQPEKPKAAVKPVAPKPVVDFKRLNRSIDDLQISSVIGGKKPRIVVGGLLVHLGEVVDPRLGLKFVALDESKRLILLANDADVIFPKSY